MFQESANRYRWRKVRLSHKEDSMYYGGMHAYWWFFWVLLWIVFFSFMMPVRRTTYSHLQSPMQVLQRRYANGEITSEEYEERRSKLLRDAKS
jgi:putative membrane protein